MIQLVGCFKLSCGGPEIAHRKQDRTQGRVSGGDLGGEPDGLFEAQAGSGQIVPLGGGVPALKGKTRSLDRVARRSCLRDLRVLGRAAGCRNSRHQRRKKKREWRGLHIQIIVTIA